MSCCTRQIPSAIPERTVPDFRVAWRGGRVPVRPPVGVVLEYIGSTQLLVTGPGTGQRYYFTHPGARMPVDLRDRASLLTVPTLRLVVA